MSEYEQKIVGRLKAAVAITKSGELDAAIAAAKAGKGGRTVVGKTKVKASRKRA